MHHAVDLAPGADSLGAPAAGRCGPSVGAPAGGRNLLGGALVVLSFALWVPLPALPFLPVSAVGRTALAGGLVAGAEVAFWLGLALAGPQIVARLRARLQLRARLRLRRAD